MSIIEELNNATEEQQWRIDLRDINQLPSFPTIEKGLLAYALGTPSRETKEFIIKLLTDITASHKAEDMNTTADSTDELVL